MRDSIILYRSLREATKQLDLETRAKVYDAVMDYAFDGTESTETGVVQAMFLMMKPIIDVNNQRFENGKKGGAPKGNQNAKKQPENNQETTKKQPNNNQTITKAEPNKDKDKDVDKDKKENTKEKRFQKPTLEEVKAYCEERNNGIDPQHWIDYYTSNGWKVGKNPMKDWKATVRTWERFAMGEQRKPVESVSGEQTDGVLVEQGKFFIDDTMPEYHEVCKNLTDDEQERAWKWIMEHFEGRKVSVDFVNSILKKFDTSSQFRQAQGF